MLPIQSQVQINTSLRKNNTNSTSDTASNPGFSDEQLQTMAAPKQVNALQWNLSSPQERQALLKATSQPESTPESQQTDATIAQTTVEQTLKHTILRTNVINQVVSDQIILDDVLDADIQQSNVVANPTNIKAANQAGVSATGLAVSSEQRELAQITQQVQTRFAATAENKTEFHSLMQKSFGAQYDVAKAETMRQQALKGDFSWIPKVQLVNGSQLADTSATQGEGVGRGAYSQSKDTIYLSRELLRSNPAMAAKVLTEEMGHAIDARINTTDAKGDEGNIFSRLSYGEKISTAELAKLKSENDSGVININGEKIEVEFFFKKLFKKAVNFVKKVVTGVKDVVTSTVDVIKDVVKGTVKVITDNAGMVFSVAKKLVESTVKGIWNIARFRLDNVINDIKQTIKYVIRKVGDSIGDTVDTIKSTGKKVIAEAARLAMKLLGPSGPKRGLTPDEINLARSVFGDSINYNTIEIYNAAWLPSALNKRYGAAAMAPNGNIYFDPKSNSYRDNYATADINSQALFIHEMVHVWQNQNGVDLFEVAIFNDNTYTYLPLVEGKTFAQYGTEQQADMVMDYFYLLNGFGDSNMPPIDVYRNLIPFVD